MHEERESRWGKHLTGANRPRWNRRSPILASGCLILAGIVATIVVVATGASGAGGYRTAVATTAMVEQTLGVTGTVAPVNQASANFQVAGAVAAVNVSVGQTVTAGQTLASLDTTTLQQNVASAQLKLSSDQAKLSEDESAQSSSTAPTTPATPAVPATPSTSPTTPQSAQGVDQATLQQDQQAVTVAQQTSDADSDKAAAALANAQTACASSYNGSGSTSPTSTTTPRSTTTTTTPSAGDSAGCSAALSAALAAQQQVTMDQSAVASAENTLAQLLSSSSSAGPGSSSARDGVTESSDVTPTGGAGPNDPTATPGRPSPTASTTGTVSNSAQQLAIDQAAIDTDQAALIEARQALDDAELTSPITGTVASVSLVVGQSVAAGSASNAITIINTGTYAVTASLTSSQAVAVHVGDETVVTIDGTRGTLDGTVSRIGPVNTSSSGDTYPLIVALSPGPHGIAAGSTAEVQVVLRQVDHTLAVPTSAVSTSGTHDSSVMVLVGGNAIRRKVTVGVIGAIYTQITSGISMDTNVVLADFSQAVPSSSTNSLNNGFGGGSFQSVMKVK
jgi:HlyD family secretion protein